MKKFAIVLAVVAGSVSASFAGGFGPSKSYTPGQTFVTPCGVSAPKPACKPVCKPAKPVCKPAKPVCKSKCKSKCKPACKPVAKPVCKTACR